MQKLDWIILAICVGMTLPMRGLGEPVFVLMERRFAQFANNRRLSLAAIGAVAILARLALLPWLPVPQPKVHDEFSYLLAADSFAHGRLANPPHALSIFFDTFYVSQHPTYSSMYPPAQGIVLAIGKLLGHPWIGVLLSVAAMCMAITWMLQGWMPAEWALLGGVLVWSRFGLFSYWMNSYWGGAVTAAGAALVLGALPRIWEHQRPHDAIILGLGAGVLATSRPLEGFIFCVPVGIALLWWTLREGAVARRMRLRRVLLPLAATLACVAGFIAYHNLRVTGNPLVLPLSIELRNYITTPVFLWQHAKPPLTYANPQFNALYNGWFPSLYQTSWSAAQGQFWWKSTDFWGFFLGPVLSIPFLTLPWLLNDRQMRFLLIQFGLCYLGMLSVVWFFPHYASPLMATVVVLMMQGMRLLRRWRFRGRAIGVGWTRLIVLFSLLIGPVYFAHMVASGRNIDFEWFHRHDVLVLTASVFGLALLRLGSARAPQLLARRPWLVASCELLLVAGVVLQAAVIQRNLYPDDYPFVDDLAEPFRKPIEQKLNAAPGEHLVLVRYSKDHNPGEEYVYNEADIDHAKIVWAREIPGMDLTPLLTYFRNREVWVYEPDEDDESLTPFSPQSAAP